MYTFTCIICKNKFETKDKRRKCCSILCANKYISIIKTGKPRSDETKRKISEARIGKYCGKNHPRYGVKLTSETKKKIGNALKTTYEKNGHPLLGTHHTEETKQKISIALKGKYCGKDSCNWQGGKTRKGNYFRELPEYKEWRESVFKKYGYVCQISNKTNNKLQVHHIESFCTNKEKRLDIDNGIVMTKKLHILFHKIYGKKNNTKEQLNDFKQIYEAIKMNKGKVEEFEMRKYYDIKDIEKLKTNEDEK